MLLLAAQGAIPSVIPLPNEMMVNPGSFASYGGLLLESSPSFGNIQGMIRDTLGTSASPSPNANTFIILNKNLSREAYQLTVDTDGIRIQAATRAGVFYALQTLRQLRSEGRYKCVEINDEPRFGWRGLHLDVSRHFFTKAEVLRYLDYMAELKLNVFHWHLIDDGGWRMEVKKYPNLTDLGAWRLQREGEVWNYSNIEFVGKDSKQPKHGGFYTQEEIREVVRYAAARNIEVIPEIELPGHCLPAMVAQPEVSCSIEKDTDRPYRALAYCAGKEVTFKFLEDVLDETMALFPAKTIHIGGDEVDKTYWSKCPDCTKRKQAEGLKSDEELQSYFVKRIEKYLNSKGRTLMGWDEILEGGLAPNAQVMSWRGEEGGIKAAQEGHEVVMTPTSHCYFDFSPSGTTTKVVYNYEPVPKVLTAVQSKLVLGAQANLWTEWIPDFNRLEYMLFPRLYAMAETLWTQPTKKNYEGFVQRLQPRYAEMARRGVDFFVEPPVPEATLIAFRDKATIAVPQTSVPGVEVRVTTDGSEPTSTSTKFTKPIEMKQDGTVRFAQYMKGQRIGDPIKIECRALKPGLATSGPAIERFFEKSWAKIPDLTAESHTTQAEFSGFSIDKYKAVPAFTVEWIGHMNIPEDGLYKFTLGSDDGSLLALMGITVVNNDFLQGYTERTSGAHLAKGVYPFRVAYFENGGAERFEARVTLPNGQTVPLASLVQK